MTQRITSRKTGRGYFCSTPQEVRSRGFYPDKYQRLLAAGLSIKDARPGVVEVNEQFEYVLNTGRWRKLGKPTWYWSKSPEQFAEVVKQS